MALALVAAVLAITGSPCAAVPARGPDVPAPIVFRTTCGAVRLDPGGRVTRLPAGWIRRQVGDPRAGLTVRRTRSGSIAVLRDGRVVWRARGLYPNDAGDIAFGRRSFAFSAYSRGVFLTDLRRPERLVLRGRGLFPVAFTAGERLIVNDQRRIVVVPPDGRIERRYPFRRGHGLVHDPDRDELWFVRRDRQLVVMAGGRAPREVRAVPRQLGWMSWAGPGLVLFQGARGLTLVGADGREPVRAAWPLRPPFQPDSVRVSPGGRAVVFRLSDARAGDPSGRAVVFVARAGRPRPVELYRHRLGPVGCGTGAAFGWHGRFLLQSDIEGRIVVADTATRGVRDLTGFARSLPRRAVTDAVRAAWLADFGLSSAPRARRGGAARPRRARRRRRSRPAAPAPPRARR